MFEWSSPTNSINISDNFKNECDYQFRHVGFLLNRFGGRYVPACLSVLHECDSRSSWSEKRIVSFDGTGFLLNVAKATGSFAGFDCSSRGINGISSELFEARRGGRGGKAGFSKKVSVKRRSSIAHTRKGHSGTNAFES